MQVSLATARFECHAVTTRRIRRRSPSPFSIPHAQRCCYQFYFAFHRRIEMEREKQCGQRAQMLRIIFLLGCGGGFGRECAIQRGGTRVRERESAYFARYKFTAVKQYFPLIQFELFDYVTPINCGGASIGISHQYKCVHTAAQCCNGNFIEGTCSRTAKFAATCSNIHTIRKQRASIHNQQQHFILTGSLSSLLLLPVSLFHQFHFNICRGRTEWHGICERNKALHISEKYAQ